MWLDTTGDGEPDVLVLDENRDGVPDVDADGKTKVAVDDDTMKKLQVALKADQYGPGALTGIGAIIGIPLLTIIGLAWKAGKFGRVFANTVLSVQAARQALKDKNLTEALETVDATLFKKQTDEAAAAIEKAKAKAELESVT